MFLIVDALDEYPENKRRDFLHILGGLPPSINVFLTSRDDIHPQMVRKMQKLVIRATEDDVKTYVRSRLEEERDSPRLGNHLLEQPSLGEDIVRNIVQKADGMHVFYSWKHSLPPAISIPFRKYSSLTSSIGSYSLSFKWTR